MLYGTKQLTPTNYHLVTHRVQARSRGGRSAGLPEEVRQKLDFYLRIQARSREGRWYWTLKRAQERSRRSWVQKGGLLLLQFFLNSCATDIVLVTAPHSSWDSNCAVHSLPTSCSGGGPRPPRSFRVGARSRATRSFSPPPPPPPFPAPNKPSRFCGCKATCLLSS